MWKKAQIATLFFFFSRVAIAQAGTDDIILQSRTDPSSLSGLIAKTEVVLANANIMSSGISSTTTLDQDPVFKISDLADSSALNTFLSAVKKVARVDLSSAVLRVKIPKISYQIDSIGVAMKGLQVNDPTLAVDTSVSLSGIDIGLGAGIQLDILIPDSSAAGGFDTFLSAIVDPVSISISKNLPPATLEVSFQAVRDQALHFSLTKYNLDALPVYIHDHEKDVQINVQNGSPISADQIHVLPKTIHLGPLSTTITFDEFKPIIREELNSILQKVVLSIGDSLKTTIGPNILKSISTFDAQKDFEISNSSLYIKYETESFSQPDPDQIAFSLSGVSCPHDLYATFQSACVDHLAPYTPARVISDDQHAAAKLEVTNKLESLQASTALSISEEYLNQLLKTTVDANLWGDSLAKNDLSLGDKGVFVVFNSANPNPDLILDLEYSGDGKGVENMIVNKKKPFRFPLRMAIAPTFELKNGVPSLVLKIAKVDSSEDEIEHGIAEFDLESKLPILLKGEIAKTILKMANTLQGTTALETDLSMLKGTGLESAWFEVSANGRLNLYTK